MDVGIRELKSRLSEYVARAAAGETVRVTDRGVPKAILAPLQAEDRISQGIREGWITRGPLADEPLILPEGPFEVRPGVTLQGLIDEDRGR